MALLGLCTIASAQTSTDFAGSLNPLFQRDLAQPSDLNNTLQYAAYASADDIESAIGTYEQLLFYNPALSKIRFELGVLYYRLGSYEMARGYFKSALEQQDMTPASAAADRGPASRTSTSSCRPTGSAAIVKPGWATRPTPPAARRRGRCWPPAAVRQPLRPRPDGNWFGAFALNYVHDFEEQRGDTFEASAGRLRRAAVQPASIRYRRRWNCAPGRASCMTPGTPTPACRSSPI